jgi:hypothetical protein
MLKIKDLCAIAGEEQGLYYFAHNDIKGFEYGTPGRSITTTLQIFTKDDVTYLLQFTGFNQKQIDYVIAPIANK